MPPESLYVEPLRDARTTLAAFFSMLPTTRRCVTLALLVLALLVALILEFDTEARREYRDAAAFRDNFKATVLTAAAVQAPARPSAGFHER